MSVDQPFNLYREQLSSLYHGLALWDPKPDENIHNQLGHVSIGDVGYLFNGTFTRMFNVTLPWADPSNKLPGKPGEYELINPSHSRDVCHKEIREGEHYTPHVSKVDNVGADRQEDSLGQMYQCRFPHRGALLSLPHKGHRKDVRPLKAFENHIKDNVDTWFRWSREMMLPVERMEDLILVTGRTLVTSWAAAAFDGRKSEDSDPATISLEARKSDGGGAQFFWRNIRGCVEYHNSPFDPNVQEPLPQNQCIFIRGFRAKRTFFRTRLIRAAAEPLPDDREDRREDEIQVTQIPDSSNYRDPLVGILDYIIQKCNEDISAAKEIIAIAHDDDLQLIKDVETLTADAIENLLHEKQMPLVVENGSAILRDPVDNEPPFFHEKKKGQSPPIDQLSKIYREQLSSYHGLALWDPNPQGLNHISIGDVGYFNDGAFIRIFNATLPRDDPSNKFIEIPEGYKPLRREHFDNVRRSEELQEEYHSHVSKVDNVRANTHEEYMGQTYECWAQSHGALLSLPHGASSEDVIRTKLFEDYIRDNVDSWLRWSKKEGLPVDNMEDLILVTGYTLAKSWAVAAFDSTESRDEDVTTISLETRKADSGGAQFVWRNMRGSVAHSHRDSDIEGPENQCVFIRGFRAKRRFFWTKHLRAAAEPLSDDPDNRREDEIQVSRIPGGSKYRDPLVGVLDYIVEKCREDVSAADDIIAIAHDDDLQLIEGVETLTADSVENYLRKKNVSLLIENGAAILRDPADNEPPVSDDKKAIFYAAAELNGRPVQMDIHPVLTKYLLKLEITESPDYDYDLPNEEMNSPAVYPHTPALRLEYFQGYPQAISLDASSDSQGAEVTVQDVLRTIYEDLRKPSSKRELGTFARGDQTAIRDTFRKRCKSEEERSKGLYRIDYLRGRDRLQILPRHPLDGTSLPTSAVQSSNLLDQSSVAGPSSIPA